MKPVYDMTLDELVSERARLNAEIKPETATVNNIHRRDDVTNAIAFLKALQHPTT